jgi:hypothetical protein
LSKTVGLALAILAIILLIFLPLSSGQEEEIQEEEKIIIKELYLDGEEKMIISSRGLILTGNMTLKNQSELTVVTSQIQLSIRGEKGYNVSTVDQSKLLLSNSTLETLSNASYIELSDGARMNLVHTNISGFRIFSTSDNSNLTILGGRLDVHNINCSGNTVSIINATMPAGILDVKLKRSELEGFKGDNIILNVNESKLNRIECNSLNLTSNSTVHLNNSRINHCFIKSDEDIIVADSAFDSLTLNASGIAINASTTWGRAGGHIQAGMNATIQRYWYLKVNVTERSGIGIPARVIVEDYFGNVTLTANTTVEGLLTRHISAEIINSTRTLFLGNYKVRAVYRNYTTSYVPIVLDQNRYVELRFKGYVPIDTATNLTVTPTEVMVDDPIKIAGQINRNLTGEYVEIVIIGPEDFRNVMAHETSEGGFFETEFDPHIEGKWTIYADWIGGVGFGERITKSQAFIVNVEPRPPTFMIFLQALPIAIVVIGVFATVAFLALSRSRAPKI